MELAEVNKDENFIELIYNKNKRKIFGNSLKINVHQIKNIESDEDTEFYIYLDGEQRIIIFTDMQVLMNYNLLIWIKQLKHQNKIDDLL